MSNELKIPLFLLIAVLSQSTIAFVQESAPVWDSFLPRIALFKERSTLDFEITFMKSGGPYYQSPECQVYVFAYLEKDESRIFELAADKIAYRESKGR